MASRITKHLDKQIRAAINHFRMIGEIRFRIHHAEQFVETFALVGPMLGLLTPSVLNALFGIAAGALAVLVMTGFQKLRS